MAFYTFDIVSVMLRCKW